MTTFTSFYNTSLFDNAQVNRVRSINLGSPADKAIRIAQLAHPLPGYIDVIAHGCADSVQLYANGENIWVTAAEVAEVISSHPDYSQGTPIRLLSCNAGTTPENGGLTVAQQIANLLNVPVIAANAYIKPNFNGSLDLVERLRSGDIQDQWVYRTTLDGAWIEFLPSSV